MPRAVPKVLALRRVYKRITEVVGQSREGKNRRLTDDLKRIA